MAFCHVEHIKNTAANKITVDTANILTPLYFLLFLNYYHPFVIKILTSDRRNCII